MTDFICNMGIHYDDYNDTHSILVCVYEEDEDEVGNSIPGTLKEFGDFDKSEQYAIKLVRTLKEGQYVVLSAHRDLLPECL